MKARKKPLGATGVKGVTVYRCRRGHLNVCAYDHWTDSHLGPGRSYYLGQFRYRRPNPANTGAATDTMISIPAPDQFSERALQRIEFYGACGRVECLETFDKKFPLPVAVVKAANAAFILAGEDAVLPLIQVKYPSIVMVGWRSVTSGLRR